MPRARLECLQGNPDGYKGPPEYDPRAVRLAAAIQQRFGLEATLHPGSGGVFDVVVDGRRIFCKHEVGAFPDEDELLLALAALNQT